MGRKKKYQTNINLQDTNDKYISLKNRKTREEILDAMQRSGGITSKACRILDCTMWEFHVLLQAEAVYGKAWRQVRREIVAKAEETMMELMDKSVDEDTRFKAAKFFMTTLGKDQGYSQDSNVMMEVQSGDGDKMT